MTRHGAFRAKWNRLLDDGKRRSAPEDRPFPTSAQLDLLKAALLPAEQAAPAWRRWKARGLELQTVHDDGSVRLFPRLWANREAAGIGDGDRILLKGVYRYTLVRNAAIISNAADAAKLFDDAGIPVLFIKGAAILALTGNLLGFRRIIDVDLLVAEADAERAIAVLLRAGYTSSQPRQPPMGLIHARNYRAPHGPEVDLHWWALKPAGDDSGMFATAEKATLLGQPALVSSATDSLIVTVGNAFQHYGSPVRWIADSMFLLTNAEIDWELFLERSRRPGLTLGLGAGLGFLASEFGAAIPSYVLDELDRRAISLRERAAHWAAVNRPPIGATILEHLERHRALRLHDPDGQRPDFLTYWAQLTGGRRRDVLLRAPRTALRSTVVLLLRAWRQQQRPLAASRTR